MSRDQINTSNFGKDDFSGKLHKLSNTSRENSVFGPSMNPDAFVPNGDIGSPPEALAKYAPSGSNPSEDTLFCAKIAARECDAIREKLGDEWLGIDYTDPNGNYNCFCGDVSPNDKYISVGTVGLDTDDAALEIAPSEVEANSAPIYSQYSPECGSKFDKYVEYSKTNATFWNTPAKTPLYRRAQTALLSYHRIKIHVYGNFNIKPGNLIRIDYPIGENENIKKSRYDGLWMVYKIKHIMTPINHTMQLYLMRDGSFTAPSTGEVKFDKRSY